MSRIQLVETFQWTTTPAELRRIASILEARLSRMQLGEDLPNYTINNDDGCELRIVAEANDKQIQKYKNGLITH